MPGMSAAGNKLVIWTFQFPAGQCLFHWTVQRRVETGLCARALGLPLKPLRLADAEGRQCRATVVRDGSFMKIASVRAL